jgi:RHS repeat-associated protein
MKKGVILLLLLAVCMPISYAKIIDIPGIASEQTKEPEPLRDDSGVKKFVYAGGNAVASIKDSEIEYHHRGRLSNRLTTDYSGSLGKKFKSLPFGQKIENTGVDYPFTGKEEDESSLYYFGARYYDDNLGRFTSVDPVKENHPYSYVDNNPMNFVDPSGMLKVAQFGPHWRDGMSFSFMSDKQLKSYGKLGRKVGKQHEYLEKMARSVGLIVDEEFEMNGYEYIRRKDYTWNMYFYFTSTSQAPGNIEERDILEGERIVPAKHLQFYYSDFLAVNENSQHREDNLIRYGMLLAYGHSPAVAAQTLMDVNSQKGVLDLGLFKIHGPADRGLEEGIVDNVNEYLSGQGISLMLTEADSITGLGWLDTETNVLYGSLQGYESERGVNLDEGREFNFPHTDSRPK